MARTAAAQPTNQDLVGVMRSANEQMQAMTGAFSEVKDRLDRQRGELAALRQENNNLHQTVEKLQETVEKQPVVKAPQKTFAKPGKPKPSEPAKHPIVVYRDQTKKAVRINEEAFTTNARRGYGDVLGLVMNHMVQSLLKVDLKPQYSIRPSTAGVLFLQAVHAGRIKKVERDLVRVDPKKDQLLLITSIDAMEINSKLVKQLTKLGISARANIGEKITCAPPSHTRARARAHKPPRTGPSPPSPARQCARTRPAPSRGHQPRAL